MYEKGNKKKCFTECNFRVERVTKSINLNLE